MSLEARLTALADDAFPPTPDLAARWAANRVPQTSDAARRRRRWWIPAVAAALLIPAGTVAAIELWGPEQLRIKTVPQLPPAPPAPDTSDLGERVDTLAQAAVRARFAPITPPFLDAPPRDIRARPGLIAYESGDATVTLVDGRLFVEKTISSSTQVDRIRVDGEEGWYFTGRHDVLVETATGARVLEPRRVGPTLVYEKDGIVVRVENVTDPARFRAP